MAKYQAKTVATEASVDEFLAAIHDDDKRADAHRLVEIMSRVTGEGPLLWGSIVGFGSYRYKYASGHEGDSFLTGFSPRKAEFSIYLMGNLADDGAALLARLGKYKMGKACLYVKRLADVDLGVLTELIAASVAALKQRYPKDQPTD